MSLKKKGKLNLDSDEDQSFLDDRTAIAAERPLPKYLDSSHDTRHEYKCRTQHLDLNELLCLNYAFDANYIQGYKSFKGSSLNGRKSDAMTHALVYANEQLDRFYAPIPKHQQQLSTTIDSCCAYNPFEM